MKKEDNKVMESLSNALFGKKYEWRKLTKRGVMVIAQDGEKKYLRRHPLTVQQAKDYMLQKLKARAKAAEDAKTKELEEGKSNA
jgi:hypothetical protein